MPVRIQAFLVMPSFDPALQESSIDSVQEGNLWKAINAATVKTRVSILCCSS